MLGKIVGSCPQKKWATKDETVGWHHRVSGHEFEQTPGDSEGQGNLTTVVHRATKTKTRLRD